MTDRRAMGQVLTGLLSLLLLVVLSGIVAPSAAAPSPAEPTHDLEWLYDRDNIEDSGDLLGSTIAARLAWKPTPTVFKRLGAPAPAMGELSEALASAFLRRAPPTPLGVL